VRVPRGPRGRPPPTRARAASDRTGACGPTGAERRSDLVTAFALTGTISEYDAPPTVDAFERVPGGEGKEERRDGRIVRLAPTGGVHGQTVAELLVALKARLRELGGSPGAGGDGDGFVLRRERPCESRAPGVRAHRLPGGRMPRRFVREVPDLAVEVHSPDGSPR
jgi:Uma2 family endonuclease